MILTSVQRGMCLPALSFTSFIQVRVARIELASQPWEGRVLPLNHTRLFFRFYPYKPTQCNIRVNQPSPVCTTSELEALGVLVAEPTITTTDSPL